MNITEIASYGREITLKNGELDESILLIHLGPLLPREAGEILTKLSRSREFKRALAIGVTPNASTLRIVRGVIARSFYNIGTDARNVTSAPYYERTVIESSDEPEAGHYEIYEILWNPYKFPRSFEHYMSYRYGNSPLQWAVPTERENDHYILTRKHHGYRSYSKEKLEDVREPFTRAPIPFGAHVNPRPELALAIASEGKKLTLNLAIIEGKRYALGNGDTFTIEDERAIVHHAS